MTQFDGFVSQSLDKHWTGWSVLNSSSLSFIFKGGAGEAKFGDCLMLILCSLLTMLWNAICSSYCILPHALKKTFHFNKYLAASMKLFVKNVFTERAAVSLQASEKYCIRMPNKWNFSFDYFYAAIVAIGIYVPGMDSACFFER